MRNDTNHDADIYLWPIHSPQLLGLNNYKLSFKHGAIIARALGRKLCMEPIIEGKAVNFKNYETVPLERAYDAAVLAEYVRVADLRECSRICGGDR